jgi:hypothetical protein
MKRTRISAESEGTKFGEAILRDLWLRSIDEKKKSKLVVEFERARDCRTIQASGWRSSLFRSSIDGGLGSIGSRPSHRSIVSKSANLVRALG